MANIQMTITGIQEVMARNNRRIATMKTGGEAEDAVRDAIIQLHHYAVQITHVDTGALRASHRMELNGLEGTVYLDPGASNPRSRVKTSVYGMVENARGGEHAFYDRTIAEIGGKVSDQAQRRIAEAVLYGK